MWILQRLVLVLAISAVLLLVAGTPRKKSISSSVRLRRHPRADAFAVIMVAFFLLGVGFYYLYSVPREWRLRSEIRRLKRSTQARDRELTELRHIALTDDLDLEEPIPDKEAAKKGRCPACERQHKPWLALIVVGALVILLYRYRSALRRRKTPTVINHHLNALEALADGDESGRWPSCSSPCRPPGRRGRLSAPGDLYRARDSSRNPCSFTARCP